MHFVIINNFRTTFILCFDRAHDGYSISYIFFYVKAYNIIVSMNIDFVKCILL